MVTSKKQATKWSGKWEEMRPIFETAAKNIFHTNSTPLARLQPGKQQVKITDVVAG